MAANDNQSVESRFGGSWTGRREGKAAWRNILTVAALAVGPAGAYFGQFPIAVGVGLPVIIAGLAGLKAANDN